MQRVLIGVCLFGLIALGLSAKDPEPKVDAAKKVEEYLKENKVDSVKVEQAGPFDVVADTRFFMAGYRKPGEMPARVTAGLMLLAVDKEGKVTEVKSGDDLEKIFKSKAAKAPNQDAAKKVMDAWLRLGCALFSEGMLRFGDPEMGPLGNMNPVEGAKTVQMSGACHVTHGGKGKVGGTLEFEDGKLVKASFQPELKNMMRPKCQATLLLHADPRVRLMCENDLLVMGRDAEVYILDQRDRAEPALRKAIDCVWQRIVGGEKGHIVDVGQRDLLRHEDELVRRIAAHDVDYMEGR